MIFFRASASGAPQSAPQERILRPNPGGPLAARRAKGSGLCFFSEVRGLAQCDL